MYSQRQDKPGAIIPTKGEIMGYSKRDNDGGASAPNLAERDAKATATRRAKAAARKGKGKGMHSSNLFDDIRDDKKAARREAEEARQRDAEFFRLNQALAAMESEGVTSLIEGSIARVFAEGIIRAFPDATPGGGMSRTSVAIETAKFNLDAEMRRHNKALAVGQDRACKALSGAYKALKENKKLSV